MSTIRETIEGALPSGASFNYRQYIDPVAAALEQREAGIYRSLADAGSRLGARRDQIAQALQQAGLTAPAPAAMRANGGQQVAADPDKAEQLTKVRHSLAGLLEEIDGLIG